MKKKKLLAIVLATTMVAGSSMTTLAAVGNPSGNGSLSGNGVVTSVDKEVYSVGMPTSAANFPLYIDPQGIADLAPDESITDAEAEAKAGKIRCTTKIPLHNMSAVELKMGVTLKLTGNATAATNPDTINDTKNHDVLIYAAPSSNPITKVANVDTEYAAPEKGVVLGTTAETLSFIMPPATDYSTVNISGNHTYVKADPALGNGTGITFGGWVNKNANWAEYSGNAPSKHVSLDVVYSYDLNSANESANDPDNSVYMVSGNSAKVEIPADSTPGVTPSFTFIRGTTNVNAEYNIPLPNGANATTGISIVGSKVGNTTPKTPPQGANWSYNTSTGKLVFPKDSPGLTSAWPTDTYTCTLTFNNSTTAVVTLILQ